MSSDSDGSKEGSGEFLFMALDNCKKNHEASEKIEKENSNFEEDEEDVNVDLEGELISALE